MCFSLHKDVETLKRLWEDLDNQMVSSLGRVNLMHQEEASLVLLVAKSVYVDCFLRLPSNFSETNVTCSAVRSETHDYL